MTPRGLRNNNPGNIRRSEDNWRGIEEVQTDAAFFQFTELKWGIRALMRLLRTYRKKYRCNTITRIIQRYAPPCENDTKSYIMTVCDVMGVSPSYVPDLEDMEDMCKLAQAICFVENGVMIEDEEFIKAWEIL